MEFRCVKCAQPHGPGKCTLVKSASKDKLLCANCGQPGHPASYLGCPYIVNINNKFKKTTQTNEQNIKRQNIITSNYIQPGRSFKEVMSGNSNIHNPHIPNPSLNYQQYHHHPPPPEYSDQLPAWYINEKNTLNENLNRQFTNLTEQMKILTNQLLDVVKRLTSIDDAIEHV